MAEYRMSAENRRIARGTQLGYAAFGVPALVATINAFVPGYMFGIEYPQDAAAIFGTLSGIFAALGLGGSYVASHYLDKP